ncbi:chloride intracellular channel exl-1-like [Homarus americanus]|uniref:Chloride intracellular channel exl-1-like n=1 Tax=Homarus americanus TaxID=6706 RepID=A0A8J5JT86_HOMAM|nr:chloride intracellular channel exl-1-like [Homarus americanus]XP_042231733.1 chloride intracellular channel exl-1-like [Homarus americanus]XP_042231734.1 chloride intracellular channel exl-1-like [Homarus americanus]XP_042231735.1 chloride intracellular channel exl-1-like [Homarus americanus]KAG7163752.1 Chloride intracellular channel exl-1-like [Homarus americanus]
MGSVGQPPAVVAGAAAGDKEEVTVYVKAGVDGERMGACPFCQRVFMVLLIKSQYNILRFKVITVNPAKPPPEFKALGLKHVPALIHGDDGYDALDDIIQYLDTKFPGGGLEYNNPDADLATKDFFSKFCFYIKAVNQDPSKLDQALQKLNHFLEKCTSITNGLTNGDTNHENGDEDDHLHEDSIQYMCSDHLTHLDCEVLPKLQHLRVASKALKDYDIPTYLRGFWRYLHAAYTHQVFVRTCPCDQEIILHWHDRPETPKLSHKKHSVIAKEKPKYSFDVPVRASVVTVVDE